MIALKFTDLAHPPRQRLRLSDCERPRRVNPDDVLIRVTHAGICGTDVHIALGGHPATPGITLGHEAIGVVEESGMNAHVAPGEHVAIDPNLACDDAPLLRPSGLENRCAACVDGLMSQCEWMARGTTIGIFRDGGMASHLIAPSGALHRVPDGLAGRAIAVLVEPLSCIENSLRQLRGSKIRRALVLGGGPMGALYAMRLLQEHAHIAICEQSPARRDRLGEILGANSTVTETIPQPTLFDPGALAEWACGLFDGHAPDLVVDAVGGLTTAASNLVRPGGAVVQLGMNQRAAKAEIDAYELVRREKRIIGSYIGKGCFPAALQSLRRGLPGVERLIDAEIALSDVLTQGFPAMGFDSSSGLHQAPLALKVIVRF
ncbi:MAG: alcohol dehydrogenase catalytic domain-containing protein [Phycisphaerales bacterium]|nr:alcohol dehydrogenase catalytic domain-containing protein [Phycisphaerales bacterium]